MTDLEQRLAKLQKQFYGLRIMGGEGVNVYGNMRSGYAVEVKAGVAQLGVTSGGGEDVPGCTDPIACNFDGSATVDDASCIYEGACCVDTDCSITCSDECGGIYQGDGTECDPNPCAGTGACCAIDQTCSITTSIDCVGTYQGDDTVCEPNPCCPPITGNLNICFAYPTSCCLITINESVDFDAGCPCYPSPSGSVHIDVTTAAQTPIICEPYVTDFNCEGVTQEDCDIINDISEAYIEFDGTQFKVHFPHLITITFAPPAGFDPLTFGFDNCPWVCEEEGTALIAILTCN